MLAARLHEYGTPLTVEEVDGPRLQGPHDVIVRVGGAGVCRTDLHIVDGMLEELMAPALPYTLGHENAGWIEEVGEAVTLVQPGDAVILHPASTCGVCAACHRGQDMYCVHAVQPGFDADGGFSTYLRTNDRAVVPLPEGLEPADVAPCADAGLAAYRAVKKAVTRLEPGQHVAVVGIGGLGHIAVQALHALAPVQVVAVDVSTDALDLAGTVGADAMVRGGESAVDAVREVTDGQGVAAVIDFVGEDAVPAQAMAMLAKGGSYFVVGYGGELVVPTAVLVGNEISVVGNLVGTHAELEELIALAASGAVHLETTPYPLSEVNDVMASLSKGEIRGRAVIVPT